MENEEKFPVPRLMSGLSLIAGACHGYSDAKGIPFQKDYMESLLTFGPAILGGAIVGNKMGVLFIDYSIRNNLINKLEDKVRNTIGRGVLSSVVGVGIGAFNCGLITLSGYATGYLLGNLDK